MLTLIQISSHMKHTKYLKSQEAPGIFYSYDLDYGVLTFYGILKNIRSKEILGKLRFLFPTYLIVTCNCRKKVLRKNSEKGRN